MATDGSITMQLNKLTCPVCCDRFKTPKILHCGHTFCQPCAHQLFQSTPVCCPVCRVQVSSSHSSVDQLPTNYALQALVDDDTYLFDKEALRRSFGECSTHGDVCDQFCKTCDKQVCKQCISDQHQDTSHDTSPVGAIVVQQKEVLGNLAGELSDVMKRLKVVGSNITESESTCQSEAHKLDKDISASVGKCADNIANHAESLQTVVREEKEKILNHLDDLKLQHSEIFLSATYALDLCQSLQIDLDKNNLSRVAVIKRLTENKRKVKKVLEKLEGKQNVLHIDLKFQSLSMDAKGGKLASRKNATVQAIHMKTVSFKNEQVTPSTNPPVTTKLTTRKQTIFASSSTLLEPETPFPLLSFIWPIPTWMICVRLLTAGSHTFVKFTNLHFLREAFQHEIGVDQKWCHVSHSDYDGNFVLCLSSRKVHKFALPSIQNLEKPGKIVSTVFTPRPILGISWDKLRVGCYALLDDRKTLLHMEFGETQLYKEVAVVDEEITSGGNTHFLHMNEEGGMAICDHQKKVVHFFEKIEAEPTLTVRAPSNLKNPTPECVNTRRGEKLWYVMWKSKSVDSYVIRLYVYDSSFQFIGRVPDLRIIVKSEKSKVMFCFQSDYVAVTVDDKVEVYGLY